MTAMQRIPHEADDSQVLVEVKHLKMYFPVTSGLLVQRTVGHVKAVDDVSFVVRRGETLGLVGESGCGKTTTGRCILQLHRPTAGTVLFDGKDLCTLDERELRGMRRHMQVIFQDPYSSLNPRMTAGSIVGEPLLVQGLARTSGHTGREWPSCCRSWGCAPPWPTGIRMNSAAGSDSASGWPVPWPPTRSLSCVTSRCRHWTFRFRRRSSICLEELQEKFDLTYLFIAHDLSVVRHISDRVAVMYLGHIMEVAARDAIYANPLHPYTQALLSAVPIPDPEVDSQRRRIPLAGEVPSPLNPPTGCVFHPRCHMATAECREVVPELREVQAGHWASCIHAPGYGSL